MTTLRMAGLTDVGRQRRDNQDAFLCEPLWNDHTALLVVIDGVGGYAGGDVAAQLARESIQRYMTEPTGDTLTMLREAVVYANNQIAQQRHADPRLSMMCCVLTAAVADVAQRKVWYAHVGDTRLYRFQLGAGSGTDQFVKVTSDHSVVGVREDANQLTEAQAMQHPRRNEVLRTVGSAVHRVDDVDFLESGEVEFGPGEGLLLCSDGLTDMLMQAEVMAVLGTSAMLEEQLAELIRQANEAGGQDNITVVLALHTAESSAGESSPGESLPGSVVNVEPVTVEPVREVQKVTPVGDLSELPTITPSPQPSPQPTPTPSATKAEGIAAEGSGMAWVLAILALILGIVYYFMSRA